jgi:ubiquinone/menaquinone biosynthesis C-methylase UbiE
MRLARLVGPGGKVYATDIQPGLLRILQRKAETEHLSNIEIVQGTETDVHVPDRTLDLALLVDVYHEFRQPREMLSSIRRALKIDGRLVIVEYRKEDPTIPIADTHRMSEADIRTEVQAERFTFDSTIEELPRQHIVVFRKTSA